MLHPVKLCTLGADKLQRPIITENLAAINTYCNTITINWNLIYLTPPLPRCVIYADSGHRKNLNVRFNIWIRSMPRMTVPDLRNDSIRDEELRKRLGTELLDEILDRRRMNCVEKLQNAGNPR